MKTLIIDEQEVIHRGVSEFLANSSFEVVAHCHNLLDYLQVMTGGLTVDLILTDASIRGMGLRRVIQTIRRQTSKAKLVVFAEFDDPSCIEQAREPGVDGYISKSVTSAELIYQLQELRRNGSIWTSTQPNPMADNIDTLEASAPAVNVST